MEISDIKIRKLFDEGPMKAIVSVTFDNQLAVHDIKVINARDKFFIVMPSRKNPDSTYRDIVHPINAQFRASLESAVIDAYKVELEAAQKNAENANTETQNTDEADISNEPAEANNETVENNNETTEASNDITETND
ncbi:MAG: septation regulator SpoVG [Clostridiales bacterium]|nr:septation regulator SpoVG [Clostridiales bacterium]